MECLITEKKKITDDISLFHLIPSNGEKVNFFPGQFCILENLQFPDNRKKHYFSYASIPNMPFLEFCIRSYGPWTKKLLEKSVGEKLQLTGPFGHFVWKNNAGEAVFIVGGLGISPVISIIRFLKRSGFPARILLIYGVRSPEAAVYQKELDNLQNNFPEFFRVIYVYSEKAPAKWTGYKGLITRQILEGEINFSKKPYFYMSGPPPFLASMLKILNNKSVKPGSIIKETIY